MNSVGTVSFVTGRLISGKEDVICGKMGENWVKRERAFGYGWLSED